MSARIPALLLLLAILAAGCGSTQAGPAVQPPPSPASMAEIKYAVIAKAGRPFVCGPPIAIDGADPQQAAADFPTIKADSAAYAAIVAHAHPAGSEASSAYEVTVWQEWKTLQAVQLQPDGGGYKFAVHTAGELVTGTVDRNGVVTVTSRTPAKVNCPICLAAATAIDTPGGPVFVTDLRIGDAVWTAAADGARVAGVVLALGRVAFPRGHDAVILVLADGRSVTASAGHPMADGRAMGQLRPGEAYDGSTVLSSAVVHLDDGATYDLLPSGPTGDYWAGGIPLGSTLFPHS